MLLFLAGSLACGLARSMPQLVAARLLQGLGAGGLLPLAFTIIADLYSYQQRVRMQGLFSGVWGVASVIGPVLGGFLVDRVGWPWVFFINLAPGVLAGIIVWVGLTARGGGEIHAAGAHLPGQARPQVDYAGGALLAGGVAAVLLGLLEMQAGLGWLWLVLGAGLLAAFGWVEQRVPEPIVPIPLLRDRLFAAASLHGVMLGWAVFGTLSYVPLFAQAVLGASATAAGATLTPMTLSWVLAAIVGSWLLLRLPYRTLALAGTALLVLGAGLMALAGHSILHWQMMVTLGLMGTGAGLTVPVFMIVVQSTVPRRWLGIATSTLQFSRSMGSTLGVSVMGAVLSLSLARSLTAAGLDPASVNVNALVGGESTAAGTAAAMGESLRLALGTAIGHVFIVGLVGAALAMAAALLAPHVSTEEAAAERGHVASLSEK
jgi:MFS family permease